MVAVLTLRNSTIERMVAVDTVITVKGILSRRGVVRLLESVLEMAGGIKPARKRAPSGCGA
jgi:hypothetical protein